MAAENCNRTKFSNKRLKIDELSDNVKLLRLFLKTVIPRKWRHINQKLCDTIVCIVKSIWCKFWFVNFYQQKSKRQKSIVWSNFEIWRWRQNNQKLLIWFYALWKAFHVNLDFSSWIVAIWRDITSMHKMASVVLDHVYFAMLILINGSLEKHWTSAEMFKLLCKSGKQRIETVGVLEEKL